MQFQTPAKCRKCGSKAVIVPENPTDKSVVICAGCSNKLGLWGKFKADAVAEVAKQTKEPIKNDIKRMVADSFKGIGNIKVK